MGAGLSVKGVLDDHDDHEPCESDEDEPKEATERSGFMQKKSGTLSGFKRRYFVLPPSGTLLWYKSEKDKAPTGFVHLADAEIVEPEGPALAKLAGNLKNVAGSPLLVRGHKDYLLVADDDSERAAWLRALRQNARLPPMAGLKGGEAAAPAEGSSPATAAKTAKRSMLGGVVLRAEKRMASRAITSDLGKKLLREFCLPETFTLLEALRNLAGHDATLPPKSGALFENTILRIAVKLVLLIQHDTLGPRALGVEPFRPFAVGIFRHRRPRGAHRLEPSLGFLLQPRRDLLRGLLDDVDDPGAVAHPLLRRLHQVEDHHHAHRFLRHLSEHRPARR